MGTWLDVLKGDPTLWLLEEENPAVRRATLVSLCDRAAEDPLVQEAQAAAMRRDPIAAILAAQNPAGYWVKPGPGYSPKYQGTVWQLIFLDQLGADGRYERVRAAAVYVLSHCQTTAGGLGCSGSERASAPPPSSVLHCLNGNLLRALIGLGWLEDERVQQAIAWETQAITGRGEHRFYASGTSGPGFACAANEGLPCAWGAIKALLGLARIPLTARTPAMEEAIAQGANFLLSHDPAAADYPAGWGNTKPSQSWFKLGFPSGYVADVLQNLEVLCELGFAADTRLRPAVRWLLSLQDERGRWKNRYSYHGKTWTDFEKQGQPSKWVTLRACRMLKARAEAGDGEAP